MMSSKKRKSLTQWSSCDVCNVIINQRDSTLHKEKSCPPNSETWIHPYISGNILHTSLETFETTDENFRYLRKGSENDFIFIPYHILHLCQIPIGDPVVIKGCDVMNKVPFVKLARPWTERMDFAVAISNEVLELNSFNPTSQVKVSKLEEKIAVASSVVLSTLITDESQFDESYLTIHIRKNNIYKIFRVGNRLLFKHYGKKINLNITKIFSNEICNQESEECFYLIGPDTKFVLSSNSQTKKQNSIRKLGGLNGVIDELNDAISFLFGLNHYVSELNMARGILIYGPVGTGKSSLIEIVADQITKNVITIECTKIFSKFVGETEKELNQYFNRGIHTSPSIILIDDLDVLCSNSSSETGKRLTATLAALMDTLNKNNVPVAVLGTTSKIHNIDPMLRSSTRFGKEVEIHVPSSSQRLEILNVLISELDHNVTKEQLRNLADSLHGYVGADIVSLVSKALFKNYKSNQAKEKISIQHFLWAMGQTKPSAMKEIMVEIPNVNWEDIGGQEDLKLKLKQCVEWPLKYKESFSALGITPPKGLLMFGPPGCSKTMIAKALATESNLNFISVKGPELFSKWVGESERAVRQLFKRARQAAPSVVFFDEIDAIGGERYVSSGSNVQERVLAQLLIELDGVEPLDNVTVIAATNRPDRIDSALLRPGRLDRIIYVPLPDYKTRKEIIVLQLNKSSVSEDVYADELAEMTDGYSGAEIVAVCREAALKALEENFKAEKVCRKHFICALEIVIPRTSKALLDMYEKYLQK